MEVDGQESEFLSNEDEGSGSEDDLEISFNAHQGKQGKPPRNHDPETDSQKSEGELSDGDEDC